MTDVSSVTKQSNPSLYGILQDLATFTTDHIPKHGKGYVSLEAEHEGTTYRAEAEWDYNHGIEWEYQDVEWFIADPNSAVACIACGHADEPEQSLESMTYEEVLQVRFELNQKLEAVVGELAKREAPIKKALEDGEKVPGFKLKKGRKTRSIVNDKALAKELEDAGILRSSIYNVKLKGVPDLEKLIRAQFDEEDADTMYAKHVKETLGKPTLEYVGV